MQKSCALQLSGVQLKDEHETLVEVRHEPGKGLFK